MEATQMSPVRIRLRELREVAGMSQATLAEKAGVREATISAIENGKTSRIDLDVLDRLADALRTDPAMLIVRVSSKGKR